MFVKKFRLLTLSAVVLLAMPIGCDSSNGENGNNNENGEIEFAEFEPAEVVFSMRGMVDMVFEITARYNQDLDPNPEAGLTISDEGDVLKIDFDGFQPDESAPVLDGSLDVDITLDGKGHITFLGLDGALDLSGYVLDTIELDGFGLELGDGPENPPSASYGIMIADGIQYSVESLIHTMFVVHTAQNVFELIFDISYRFIVEESEPPVETLIVEWIDEEKDEISIVLNGFKPGEDDEVSLNGSLHVAATFDGDNVETMHINGEVNAPGHVISNLTFVEAYIEFTGGQDHPDIVSGHFKADDKAYRMTDFLDFMMTVMALE